MVLTMINDDLSRFEEMYNNHKLSTENYFTPLQLLCMRIEMVAEDVEVDWARYGLNPEDLQEAEINYREIDNDMCNPLRDAEDANADRVEDGVDDERLSENEIDSPNRDDRLFYPLTIPISEEEF